jgi:hypothetical protein
MYRSQREKLDDVEYKYLHEQLQHIQSKRDHGIKCALPDDRLEVLQKKLQKRFDQLRRVIEYRDASRATQRAMSSVIVKETAPTKETYAQAVKDKLLRLYRNAQNCNNTSTKFVGLIHCDVECLWEDITLNHRVSQDMTTEKALEVIKEHVQDWLEKADKTRTEETTRKKDGINL